MTAHNLIRLDISNLVENRMRELELDWLGVSRRRAELFDGPLCTMVNPGCPEDLCYLPYDHVGSLDGFHVTGTTSYDYAIHWPNAGLAPVDTPRKELVHLGYELADRMGW